MNCGKICKNCFVFLLVFFLFIYVVGGSSFYEYKLNLKKTLTEEQIKKFENDVDNGVDIDINDYLVETSKNYDNVFTNFNRSISKYIDRGFEEIFKYIFRYIETS